MLEVADAGSPVKSSYPPGLRRKSHELSHHTTGVKVLEHPIYLLTCLSIA